MKTIGIICACDTELLPFLPHLEKVQVSEAAMHRFYSGFLSGCPVVCVQCGICKVNAALAAQLLIDRYHVGIVINSGTAGGMDPRLHILDTVISEKIAHHDIERDILTEEFPYMETEFFHAGEGLLAAAKKAAEKAAKKAAEGPEKSEKNPAERAAKSEETPAEKVENAGNGAVCESLKLRNGAQICFGTMVSGEAFIDDRGRAEINRRFSPLTVDMETAGIAHACYMNGVPFLAVRTVTDTEAERGLSVYSSNSGLAGKMAADFTMAVIKELFHAENE